LSHGEQTPITREQVWSGLQGHRRLAKAARKRILERQITEDTQVEQYKSLTRNTVSPIFARPEALPFETVAMDFIVKLPLSEGYDSILTIMDHDCTKMTIFIPCNESISAEGVARLYLQHVFKNYGLPQKIISDRDTRFTGKFMRELCRILGIQQNMSTAYHPRTNGQSERSNQWIEQFFRFYIDEDQKNWASYLPLAEFVHNSWRNESTGQTLFEVLMGYSP
jgi:transposase InsO family protein